MYFISTLYLWYGAVAQLARAPALQAGGQEFDSPQLHHADLYWLAHNIWNYKQAVQGKRLKNCEIVLVYIEQFWKKFNVVMRSLKLQRKHIEKYIDEIR